MKASTARAGWAVVREFPLGLENVQVIAIG
jgi:hypothetical protein